MFIYALTVFRNIDKGQWVTKYYYKKRSKAILDLRTKFNEEFGTYRYFPGYKRTEKDDCITCDVENKNLGSVYIDKIKVIE